MLSSCLNVTDSKLISLLKSTNYVYLKTFIVNPGQFYWTKRIFLEILDYLKFRNFWKLIFTKNVLTLLQFSIF